MANQRATSSSASFTNSWKNQVFLSFRGEDTRHNFTDHLYSALCQRGINTFRDDDELERGEEISTSLLTAIEESKISVVVFSKNYASSKWCLDELVKILDCKESNQQLVIPVFYKVNPSDVRNHRGSFRDALAKMDCNNVEKINRWKEALSQAGKLAGFTLSDEHQSESKFIQNIIEEISKHAVNLVCLEVAEHPVGMQAQVQVMNKLLNLGKNDVRMVGVWGTGGIGKTTIAKAVYNSIAHKFEGCSFLANVRERSTSHEGSVGLRENLLFEILGGKKLEVANIHKGATMIKQRLSCRKVLLVLDDVDDMEQLHKLVGAYDWFGAGSRIIITTRDKQLLTAHEVNLIHEVKILDNHKALELFCWHAFKRSGPPLGDYVKLAERAILYAQGLPLALKVLGSCLYGGSIDKWEAALDGFKSKKIQDVLKISYNALDHSIQQVFLDIACFFKDKSTRYAIETLEACDLNPRYGIEVLIEKALISVEHGDYIRMHDLLEKMGKDIIEQESPNDPGEHSRLWFHGDVKHVLTNNTGTNKITGIVLNFPKQDDEIFLNVGRSFSKMKNLQILINYNVCLSGDPSSIPNNLRVLEWHGCPFQSFPANFLRKALFVLNPFRRRIKQLGEGLKHLTKLTSLNFKGSKFLIEIPDLSSSPNLRYLNAKGCTSLVEVHPSIGNLDKLVVLDFRYCGELTKFPNKVRLKSLNFFGLFGCIKLESFPEFVDKMISLDELDLGITAIKELPSSIGNLTTLKKLMLSGSAIKELPASIGHLIGLRRLSLSGSAIKELPASIGHLTGLEILRLSGSAIKELPSSIGNLIALEILDLSESAIKELPSSIGNLIALKELDLYESAIKELPSSIGNLIGLKELDLYESAIKELPSSIGNLIGLKKLSLSKSAIKELPSSIGNLIGLKELDLYESPIKELPSSIGNLIGLKELNLYESAIKELPSSIGNLIGLKKLSLSKSAIKELPSSIGNLIGLKELDLSESAIKELPSSIGNLIGLKELDLSESAIKELPSSIGNLIGLKKLSLSKSAIKELPSSIGNLTALELLNLEGCDNLANLPQSIYGLQNLEYINLNRCPKLVKFPNNLISEVLSSAKSLPLEVRTNAISPRNGDFVCQEMDFQECNVSDIDSLENFCCWSNLTNINLSKNNFVCLPVCISKCVNLKELDLSGCKRLVEILVQLPASIKWVSVSDCISLERFSTLSKILEDGDMQGISHMDLSNCHRLCDNLGLDVLKMTKLFNEMKMRERITVNLPGNGSEVPEWFTFRNYFDDYDESKFDYIDDYGRSVRNYELAFEIPWTSVLKNIKLVLCAVVEITESFVSRCSLRFEWYDYLYMVDVSGGEIGAGNVWLYCIPISYYKQLKTRSFRVTVYGKGLRIKSIGSYQYVKG